MHIPTGKGDRAFQQEIERILCAAGHGLADFTRFVFPSANYKHKLFDAECVFVGAKFHNRTEFIQATFAGGADFQGASFTQGADFAGAILSRGANFISARFHRVTSFSGATFAAAADFTWAKFLETALFHKSKFNDQISFHEADFTQTADFSEAIFDRDTSFYGAIFEQDAKFNLARLADQADFTRAKFLGVAEFLETSFRRDDGRSPGPVFSLADFSRPEAVIFYKTYLGQALFHNCNVSNLSFISVEWRRRKRSRKRMVFEEEIDLGEVAASALRPNVGNPNKRDYELIDGLYQQLKKNYDEAKDYWTAGDFHFGEMEMKRLSSSRKSLVARYLHQHLRLAAWYKYASNYGESFGWPAMWLFVILLVFGASFPFAGLRSDVRKQLATTAVRPSFDSVLPTEVPDSADLDNPYAGERSTEKTASAHPAQNPRRGTKPLSNRIIPPAGRLPTQRAGTRATTTLPSQPDAQEQSSNVILTYAEPFLPDEEHKNPWTARRRLFENSLITALDVAAFQKDLVYLPVYPWGRLLVLAEMLLTSSLFALFLLAVRRQFRR